MRSGAYAEFGPRQTLRAWVRLIWTYEDDAPSRVIQRIPPDGCPELIVHLGEPYEEEMAPGRMERQAPALFAGQMTRPLALRAIGPVKCVALRFEPDGAAPWFGASMEEATDRRVDVSDRIAMATGADAAACTELLQDLVEQVLKAKGARVDSALRAEVRRQEEGTTEANHSPAERRRMQRLFLSQVGVSPRMLRSVFRFRKVFDHATGASGAWLSAALEAGYFDQPQMARDFQRFLGCSATTWAREQVELARSIASPRIAP